MVNEKKQNIEKFSHDALYKKFFSDSTMVRSLLEDFIVDALALNFDFNSLERVSSSYVSDDLRERHNDVVWRVKLNDDKSYSKQGSWCYLYLMLEFQSTIDYWMSVRILSYTALLWQDLIRQKKIKRGEYLPPILPIIIYSGEGKWTAKTNVAQLMLQDLGSLAKYQPRQEYFVLDEAVLGAANSSYRHGLTSLLLRLEKAKDQISVQKLGKMIVTELLKPENIHMQKLFSELFSIAMHMHKYEEHTKEYENIAEEFSMLSENIAYMVSQSHVEGVKIGKLEGMELGKLEGMELGKLEGMELGKLEGIELGKLEGIRNMLIQLIHLKWGGSVSQVVEKIQYIYSIEQLEHLSKVLVQISDPNDFEKAVEAVL